MPWLLTPGLCWGYANLMFGCQFSFKFEPEDIRMPKCYVYGNLPRTRHHTNKPAPANLKIPIFNVPHNFHSQVSEVATAVCRVFLCVMKVQNMWQSFVFFWRTEYCRLWIFIRRWSESPQNFVSNSASARNDGGKTNTKKLDKVTISV